MADSEKYSYSAAYDLRRDKKYEEAFEIYRHFAELGESHGQYFVGLMYYMGEAVVQDIQKALEYFKAAAEQGHEEASLYLANIYFYGEAGEENYPEALKYYENCQERLRAATHLMIADVYYEGRGGVPQDYSQALRWYRQAEDLSGEYDDEDKVEGWYYTYRPIKPVPCTPEEAAKGRIDALIGLAFMYKNGKGVEKNPKKALDYFVKAAKMGSDPAKRVIGDMYFEGVGVTQDFEEAVRWYKQVGNGSSYSRLAEMYLCGQGVEQDKETAMGYYQMAIANGDEYAAEEMKIVSSVDITDIKALADAFFEIGKKYSGRYAAVWNDRAGALGHVEAMIESAKFYLAIAENEKFFKWCELAIEKGSSGAISLLADRYRRGDIVPQDGNKAIELYKQVIECGDKSAYISIADMYKFQQGVPYDVAESLNWLLKGGEAGHGLCYVNLGCMYYQGSYGIEPDFDLAAEYFDKADALGCTYWANVWRGYMEKERAKRQLNKA